MTLSSTFANDISAFIAVDERLEALARKHGATLCYGVEDHRGYGRMLVQVLNSRGRTVLVVNPLWTHRQKDFYGQDKDDTTDARAIAAVVLRRGGKLPDATEASEISSSIREAARMLEDLSRQRTRALNRLHLLLTGTYLAAYKQFFSKLKTPWALRFFERFPVPHHLENFSVKELAVILLELAGGRTGTSKGYGRVSMLLERAQGILKATEAIRAQPQTPTLGFKAEIIRQLCQELLLNHERTLRLRRILRDELLPASGQHLHTLPGVGEVLAATVLGEVGDIRRFPSRHAFAKYNGTAPASRSTGGRERHTAWRSCNHRLKRAMWLMAIAAVRHDPVAREYYEACVGRGMSKLESIKRVARRMSDIIHAMLRGRAAYDSERVRASMAMRRKRQIQACHRLRVFATEVYPDH